MAVSSSVQMMKRPAPPAYIGPAPISDAPQQSDATIFEEVANMLEDRCAPPSPVQHNLEGESFDRPVRTIPGPLIDDVAAFTSAMTATESVARDRTASEREIQNAVDRACNSIAKSLRTHIERDARLGDEIGRYVFRKTSPYFLLSKLIDRSYRKPGGYAGDFLTIEMVYNDQPHGEGHLGRYIDRWFLDIPASCAVKNRRNLLSDTIHVATERNRHSPTRVTSLASGPARELFDALQAHPAMDLAATCVDIDEQALAYAWSIAHKFEVSDRFDFVRDNVVRLALGRGTTVLVGQHLIYSIGLIDYLDDNLVVQLLDWIYDHLLPGGTAVVGNFDVANPNRTFMDHILDWRLTHRSAEELRQLFSRSKFRGAPVDVKVEESGVNLFAFGTRPRDRFSEREGAPMCW